MRFPNSRETILEKRNDLFMMFDVESIGLHGECFAVGWVVIDLDGNRLDEGFVSCAPEKCAGTDKNREWVAAHVPVLEVTSPTRQHMLNTFWHIWRHWEEQGAKLVADCTWPVETNFLSACIALNHAEREWQGPYPLYDLTSVLLALGRNPVQEYERVEDELPAHHPLHDARQSARLLVEALQTGPARLNK